jgi:flagellar L-ring protein precursor FlgH
LVARLAAGVAIGVAGIALVLPGAAHANLFGKKKPPVDFTTTMPVPTPPPPPANGAIYQASTGYAPLYEGWRAKRVGDPLTIILVENTSASKSASSKLDSNGNIGLTPPKVGPLAFDPGMSTASGTRGFNGSGTADQSNSLTGSVSVTVAAVYPNGTMLVQGTKRVTLNKGDEYVQIRGIVRMADVDTENTVPSTRVADAQIMYTGKGDVARAARQGWLAHFFGILSPF